MKQKSNVKKAKTKEAASGKGEKTRELMELSHEAVPGYPKVFYIVFVLSLAYVALILLKTL